MFTGDWRYDQGRMRKPLDLVGLVDPDLWARYLQATDVHRRLGVAPPTEWAPRIAAEAEAWAEGMLVDRLHDFDTSDLAVANLYLGINSSWGLEAWKRQTKDWPERMAELRRRRDEYEREQRLALSKAAPAIAAAAWAEDEARALSKTIYQIVRASLVEPGCVVRATAPSGERRTLDWVELRAAIPDLPTNTLTIGGVVFSMVQVETQSPVVSKESAKPQLSDREIAALMTATQETLRAEGKKHGRNVIVSLMAEQLGMKQASLRLIWDRRHRWEDRPAADGASR